MQKRSPLFGDEKHVIAHEIHTKETDQTVIPGIHYAISTSLSSGICHIRCNNRANSGGVEACPQRSAYLGRTLTGVPPMALPPQIISRSAICRHCR